MQDFLTVDENLRAAMRFFGEATGSGDIAMSSAVLSIFSGLDYGVFNIAMLEERLSSPHGSLESQLAEAARFFKTRTQRWSFWLCEDYLDPAQRRRERQVLADFGLRAISHPPGMIAQTLNPPSLLIPPIELQPVESASLRKIFAEITAVSFDIPYAVAHAVYATDRAWRGSYKGFVGFSEGKPVSIVAIVAAADALGVYSLATHPSFRQRGFGEATLRAALDAEKKETGLSRIVLESTEAGYALYKRMGFREVTRYSVYLTR